MPSFEDGSLAHAAAAERFAGGDEEIAASIDARILALDPNRAAAFVLRGIIQSEKGRYRAAVLDFDRAVALSPRLNRHLAQPEQGASKVEKAQEVNVAPIVAAGAAPKVLEPC